MEMESTRVWILVRAVGLQYLCVHRARHARAAFANRKFQSRGENRRAFSNHRFARAELDLPALALAQLLARYVVESGCARSLGGSSSALSANGRTRPVASSMLTIGGEAALTSIVRRSGRSTSLRVAERAIDPRSRPTWCSGATRCASTNALGSIQPLASSR